MDNPNRLKNHRIQTTYNTLSSEIELPIGYLLYKTEIIKRFNLTYECNFIFTNKDNKEIYISNESEYKQFISLNKELPIILSQCDSLCFTNLPNAPVTTKRKQKSFLLMGSMATLPLTESDEPQKEDDEYQEEEEIIDLNETQPEPKLVKLPPVRMGSGKPPRPHKTVHN